MLKYDLKEYKCILDTPLKREKELAIASNIMKLLNDNKYSNIETFFEKHKTYTDFVNDKSLNINIVINHWSAKITDEDYIKMIDNIKALTNNKTSFDKDIIKTTNLDDKQYNVLEGKEKDYFLDNSNSGNKTIEEELIDLQPTQQEFQTADKKTNTENMFKELEESKKESLGLKYLHEINYPELSDKDKVLFKAALKYQNQLPNQVIRIDLQRELIVDEDNQIYKIEKENGEFKIKDEDNEVEKVNVPTQKQFKLTKNNSNYNAA